MSTVLGNGHVMQTTFFEDFDIAECYGEKGILDTYLKAIACYLHKPVYMAELAVVLNNRGWYWYKLGVSMFYELYFQLFNAVEEFAEEFVGADAEIFYQIID